MKDRRTWRDAVIICLGIPLLFVTGTWGKPAFVVYSLTYGFFGILMNGEYPPIGSGWFWKALAPIVVLHLAIVGGLVAADLKVPEIQGLPRILFSLVTAIALGEWRIALWILEISRPKGA